MHESLKKYKKQKNSCIRLCKKAHKKFFTNLDLSKIYGNKTFRKTIQVFFSGKRNITKKFTVTDEDEAVISDGQLISEEFNQFFKTAAKALNIWEKSYLIDKKELSNTANNAISKYRNHLSILLIKDKIRCPASFSFKEVLCKYVSKHITKNFERK